MVQLILFILVEVGNIYSSLTLVVVVFTPLHIHFTACYAYFLVKKKNETPWVKMASSRDSGKSKKNGNLQPEVHVSKFLLVLSLFRYIWGNPQAGPTGE